MRPPVGQRVALGWAPTPSAWVESSEAAVLRTPGRALLPTMAGASLTRRQRSARVLLAAPLGTAAGCLALWAMHSNRAFADRINWPWWLVALLAGAVVVGPVFIAAEALNSRIRRAAGLPPFRTHPSATHGEPDTAPAPGDQ